MTNTTFTGKKVITKKRNKKLRKKVLLSYHSKMLKHILTAVLIDVLSQMDSMIVEQLLNLAY